MIEVLEVIFALLVVPAGLAWIARRYIHIRNALVGWIIVILSAAAPALWFFFETQNADSITRAASIFVTPILFLLMLIPAALGYAVARPKQRS